MYKFVFYAPVDSVEKIKSSVFETGAGKLGDYECCSFETKGIGQFKPLANANPTIGSVDNLERVEELRVEILCLEENIREAIIAMKKAHPYEEPAYEVYELLNHKY